MFLFKQLKYTQVCECPVTFSAVSDTELMDIIANVEGFVIVNKSLYWMSYSYRLYSKICWECIFFTGYSYMLQFISVYWNMKNLYCSQIYLRIIFWNLYHLARNLTKLLGTSIFLFKNQPSYSNITTFSNKAKMAR